MMGLLLGLTTPARAADRDFIGAYDPEHWAGLTMCRSPGEGFGFYLEIEKGGATAAGYDLFHIVKRVGSNSGDGRYASLLLDASLPFGKMGETPILDKRLPSETVQLEWSVTGPATVCGKITNRSDARIRIRFYQPWDMECSYAADERGIQGAARSLRFRYTSSPAGVADGTSLLYPPPSNREQVIRFAARIGEGCIYLAVPPDLDAMLESGRRSYEERRVKVDGENSSLAESIVNNLNWMVALQPELPALYTPAGRRWIFPGPTKDPDDWTVFEWDSFFNGLLLGVESFDLAKAAVRAVLRAQFDAGNIPNWRSRHAGSRDRAQPPVGAFAVLKLYQRFKDIEFLRESYPALKRFNLYWTAPVATGHPRRDGNDDGLLEWGSDRDQLAGWVPEWERDVDGRTRAAWESGEDDLPNFDGVTYNESTWTLEMNGVDLNSLYALDCECLSVLARELGETADEKLFRDRYEKVKRLMNERLWDEEAGIYKDRFWDGRMSGKIAAANFLPLLAGVPDEPRARRMLGLLMDPSLFWGDYVVPTINRKDPAFQDQQYWRGTIWPPTNYLLYQGLRRNGFYKEAAELSQKSLRLFLLTWDTYQLCRENYDSRTGEGGGHRYQSWGPLFALTGIEEFIDWDLNGRMIIGAPESVSGSILKNVTDGKHRYDVETSRRGIRLSRDGQLWMSTDRPVVVVIEKSEDRRVEAVVHARESATVSFSMAGKRFSVAVDGKAAVARSAQAAVGPGVHQVEMTVVE